MTLRYFFWTNPRFTWTPNQRKCSQNSSKMKQVGALSFFQPMMRPVRALCRPWLVETSSSTKGGLFDSFDPSFQFSASLGDLPQQVVNLRGIFGNHYQPFSL